MLCAEQLSFQPTETDRLVQLFCDSPAWILSSAYSLHPARVYGALAVGLYVSTNHVARLHAFCRRLLRAHPLI